MHVYLDISPMEVSQTHIDTSVQAQSAEDTAVIRLPPFRCYHTIDSRHKHWCLPLYCPT